ncbi:cold-shock protein [Alkalitalea saponilacus]|uniref:Cold shock protein, CspA family n=1 Tax=Alkalitalea saponilacus TaxID=889453 RepID=A0A1T5BWU7_9BACT|nr:cold shock domain-containing protein [Alkalitalea saponilacus]ASB49565.1 DNA-binding protein [Alkalitalea saponilacus]SKB51614.1 Cold shock protein, CspA family [Alkalitalea saponilacus]
MARSQETFGKKEREKKKQKKKQDKEKKKENRQKQGLDDMIAYVDENGNITSTPPDPGKKKKEVKIEDIEISVSRQKDPDPEDLIRHGIVTYFNDSKGYGFIKDLETQESVFVHLNGLLDRVRERDKVIFETEKGPKGLNAIKVKFEPKVEKPAPAPKPTEKENPTSEDKQDNGDKTTPSE